MELQEGKTSHEFAFAMGRKVAFAIGLAFAIAENRPRAGMVILKARVMYDLWGTIHAKNRTPLLTGWRLGAKAAGARAVAQCGM